MLVLEPFWRDSGAVQSQPMPVPGPWAPGRSYTMIDLQFLAACTGPGGIWERLHCEPKLDAISARPMDARKEE